jgi:hypothetical protein
LKLGMNSETSGASGNTSSTGAPGATLATRMKAMSMSQCSNMEHAIAEPMRDRFRRGGKVNADE